MNMNLAAARKAFTEQNSLNCLSTTLKSIAISDQATPDSDQAVHFTLV